MKIAALLRLLVDAIEAEEQTGATKPAEQRYYTRRTAPEGARGRTWDTAVRDLTPRGEVVQPGRDLMIRCETYHQWIDSHVVKRTAQLSTVDSSKPRTAPNAENDDDTIDFAEFKRTALRTFRKRAAK